MNSVNIKGHQYALTSEGRLRNHMDWNMEIAQELAAQDGVTLTDAHWEVIWVIRDYYIEYGISPIRKLLKKQLAKIYGPDKATDAYLGRLFPHDAAIQGSKYAGTPMPALDAELDRKDHVRSVQPVEPDHFTDRFELNGKVYRVYPNGTLVNMEDWNEEVAQYMAQKEGITLQEEHWKVIRFLRKFYFQYGIAPMVRLLMAHMREQFGPEKADKAYLYQLFPGGPARQGSRLGGLPEPQGCIDR